MVISKVSEVDQLSALQAALQLALKIVGKLFALRRVDATDEIDESIGTTTSTRSTSTLPTTSTTASDHSPHSTLTLAIRRFNDFVALFINRHAQLHDSTSQKVMACDDARIVAFEMTCQLLVALDVALSPDASSSTSALSAATVTSSSSSTAPAWFEALSLCSCSHEPRVVCVATTALCTLLASRATTITLSSVQRDAAVRSSSLLPSIVHRLWQLLEVVTNTFFVFC